MENLNLGVTVTYEAIKDDPGKVVVVEVNRYIDDIDSYKQILADRDMLIAELPAALSEDGLDEDTKEVVKEKNKKRNDELAIYENDKLIVSAKIKDMEAVLGKDK